MNQSWKTKYRLLDYDIIDSTNSEAIRIAKTRPIDDLVILAKSQNKGRGRDGKYWQSDIGNLYASILLNNYMPSSNQSQLTLVAALAVHEVVNELLLEANNSQKATLIKWPNDILVDNKKIAGILLESVILNSKNSAIIVGIGINITNHPSITARTATDLLAEGVDCKIEQVLNLLMINFDKYFCIWKDYGYLNIKNQWLSKAAGLGKSVIIKSNDNELVGTFEDLDDEGNIKIRDNEGKLSTYLTGEVSLMLGQ